MNCNNFTLLLHYTNKSQQRTKSILALYLLYIVQIKAILGKVKDKDYRAWK